MANEHLKGGVKMVLVLAGCLPACCRGICSLSYMSGNWLDCRAIPWGLTK